MIARTLADLLAASLEAATDSPENPLSVESVNPPSQPGVDTLDTTPIGPFQQIRGLTQAQLRTEAGDDWNALEADPEALEAFALALRLAEIRSRGELPDHYTRKALCRACGPVWLFPGEAKRVLGCPWCENTANGLPIPRPPVTCSDCRHWRPNTINPPGGLGSCAIAAPTSKRPGTLWPRGEITCGDWRP